MTGEVAPGCEWARIGRYLDTPNLLKVLPVSKSTLEEWLKCEKFPQPAKLGGKRLWPEILVERYLQSQVSIAPSQAAFDAAAAVSDAARRAMGPLPDMAHQLQPPADVQKAMQTAADRVERASKRKA